jgi:4-methyl-5(b-hydroxyethyl)-thiazole monophosphate biosynthesis
MPRVLVPLAAVAAVAAEDFDMLVLPGGEPGTTHLAADPRLGDLLRRFARERRPLGALCAAPRVLAALGLLQGRAATSHPSVEPALRAGGALYDPARVVRDGTLLTSRGPGTALEFALAALEILGLESRAAELGRGMQVATGSRG